jgi:hypothetical protein
VGRRVGAATAAADATVATAAAATAATAAVAAAGVTPAMVGQMEEFVAIQEEAV